MSHIFTAMRRLVEDIEELGGPGELAREIVHDWPAYDDAIKHSDAIDDRKLLLEKALVLMAKCGESGTSPDLQSLSKKLEAFVIDLLYKDLPHPPSGYTAFPSLPAVSLPTVAPALAGGTTYAFRTPDGSYCNPAIPSLGKAGSPYARSVPPLNTIPPASLPDPGLVFDTLLARDEQNGFTPHPGGINSLFFAYADLIIHSIFNTDYKDGNINNSSSYLDLSILYGSTEEAMTGKDGVRRVDGTGRLWEDVWADKRLLFMPPATCALLVLLCRNHNYVADKILNIDERHTYTRPEDLKDEDIKKAQDDEIFHRARLVNCGYFMQIILGDYVGAILGLARDGFDWRLNPVAESRRLDHSISPRGEGNVVSIEFNLLYRWHSTLSKQDTTWTEQTFKRMMPGKDPKTITPADFRNAVRPALDSSKSIRDVTFHGLVRGSDGRFDDGDLAKIIQEATANRAGAFKARGIPTALRVIEIMGIEQARKWGTCSLNEFRKFLGLKPYASFHEWNPDASVSAAAESLYKDIDNLELHVGLQAEETKKKGPGAGLCPGYTISRAILADAVALTRGDRFLTIDFTPYNLTSWGYRDCQFDKEDGSFGGMLTKLLFRTLPRHYTARSAYAHFPFLDPAYIKEEMWLKSPQEVVKYDWNLPRTPKGLAVVDSYREVERVLSSPAYNSGYKERLRMITPGSILPDTSLAKKILFLEVEETAKYFEKSIKELINERSYGTSTTKYLDVVGDVLDVSTMRWVCNELVGMPWEVKGKPVHQLERDYYNKFGDVCQYVYLNLDPTDDWRLRESATKFCSEFVHHVKERLEHCSSKILTVAGSVMDSIINPTQSRSDPYSPTKFLSKVHHQAGAHTPEELAVSLFCEIVPTTAHFSQAISIAVKHYLANERSQDRDEIVRLSASHTKEANIQITSYIRRALISDPPVSGVYRTVLKDDAYPGAKAGDQVFASILSANLDHNRPSSSAGILEIGEHGLLSATFFEAVAPRVLGTILSLSQVKCASGPTGKFNSFVEELHGTPQKLYINSVGAIKPWPSSLSIQYENI